MAPPRPGGGGRPIRRVLAIRSSWSSAGLRVLPRPPLWDCEARVRARPTGFRSSEPDLRARGRIPDRLGARHGPSVEPTPPPSGHGRLHRRRPVVAGSVASDLGRAADVAVGLSPSSDEVSADGAIRQDGAPNVGLVTIGTAPSLAGSPASSPALGGLSRMSHGGLTLIGGTEANGRSVGPCGAFGVCALPRAR